MFLFSGKFEGPEIADGEAADRSDREAGGLWRGTDLRGAQPETGENAHERGADGGEIAEQAFRVAHVVIGRIEIEVMREETAIDPGDEVLGHVHEGNVAAGHADAGDGNPAEEDPVADEASGESDPLGGGAVVPEIEEADDEVADADSLEHAVEAHVRQVEERENC